jgi:hypothetical protein
MNEMEELLIENGIKMTDESSLRKMLIKMTGSSPTPQATKKELNRTCVICHVW